MYKLKTPLNEKILLPNKWRTRSFPFFGTKSLVSFEVTLPNPLLFQTTKLVFWGKMPNPQYTLKIIMMYKHISVNTATVGFLDAARKCSTLSSKGHFSETK